MKSCNKYWIFVILAIEILSFIKVQAQSDLFLDRTTFGLIFFDKQKFEECKMCRENLDEYDKKLDQLSSLSEKITFIHNELKKDLKGNIKSRLILTEIRFLVEGISNNPEFIYNVELEKNQDYEKTKKGALEIFSLFDKAIEFAEDNSSKDFLRRARMKYTIETGLYGYIEQENWKIMSHSMLKTIDNLSGTDKVILETLNQDYQLTSFIPFNFYTGINLGLNLVYGKNSWWGGEISYDGTDHKNPFKIYKSNLNKEYVSRGSYFGSSFLYNRTNKSFDLSLYAIQFRSYNFLHLNLFQFGLHHSQENGSSGFYKPEIGFGFGPISISYGYNLTFKKDLRPLTENHFLSVKLNYPLIRTSPYHF